MLLLSAVQHCAPMIKLSKRHGHVYFGRSLQDVWLQGYCTMYHIVANV